MEAKDEPDVSFRQIVIIGAGLGGLAMGCELKRKLNFHDFIIYERNEGLGGTWYDNNCTPHSAPAKTLLTSTH